MSSFSQPQSQHHEEDGEPAIEAQRLELSLSPEDGSLLTAPLSTVLLAATDGLYTDLYNMAQKEIEITQSAAGSGAQQDAQQQTQAEGAATEEQPPAGTAATATTAAPTEGNEPPPPQPQPAFFDLNQKKTKVKMSKINYAQRRHEFSTRLAQHGKSLAQVAALTAASHCSNLGLTTKIAATALTHARTAWLKADEAQDALFYFHAGLFPARQAPHDVLAALDICLGNGTSARKDETQLHDNNNNNKVGGGGGGRWKDLPNDLKLVTDRFLSSAEHSWNKQQVTEAWHMAIRDKLVRGEVGWLRRKSLLIQNQLQKEEIEELQTLQVPTTPLPIVSKPLWKVSLHGGIVKLTHGLPKSSTSNLKNTSVESSASESKNTTTTIYPLEANVSILSAASNTEWTLLSVEVRAEAKTGESNHQLDTNMRQRYDLHRLCAQAMAREEARARKLQDERKDVEDKIRNKNSSNGAAGGKLLSLHAPSYTNGNIKVSISADGKNPAEDDLVVARPLECLFRVAHVFHLSWQLEILSSQAQALKKGPWASAGLVVAPVQFNDEDGSNGDGHDVVLGQLSISFWSVDDRYGPPSMGDLGTSATKTKGEGETPQGGVVRDDVSIQSSNTATTATTEGRRKKQKWLQQQQQKKISNHLTLSIRAESEAGICISLSGGESIMAILAKEEEQQQQSTAAEFIKTTNGSKHIHNKQQQQQMSITVKQLLDAASNPFALSASDALLAATRLSAERKCNAIVQALQPPHTQHQTVVLPSWIHLTAERGTITVAARITYGQQQANTDEASSSPYVVLFRLACDARTGTFVATFARTARLLQLLACNHVASSEVMAMRVAKLSQNRRKASAAAVASQNCTGRAVRDAFNGLTRSLNLLGQRTGVGGPWDDNDDRAASLRQRAIHLASTDVRVSLMTCCGMAAVYGLSALALGAGTGVTAAVDMAGGTVDPINGTSFLSAPPVSITLNQQIVQKTVSTNTGDKKRLSLLERDLFGVSCSVSDNGLTLYGFDITVQLESPSMPEDRQSCDLVHLESAKSTSLTVKNGSNGESRPQKRAKIENKGVELPDGMATSQTGNPQHRALLDEVERLASAFAGVLEFESTD